ncbi:ARMT1-like domain-containing protein [Desulfosporosinus sp. PR]|uniref:damage-control phosphatase ARMT1 family protein n=1 Tax=Candidatus Desulfosporosinus nitrosoreducens TaxID=3401928 RepID=UPI0027FC7319|nr:ARMT1-like domain-containing protein [Desulfosporosinus sp. PR]MDQ7092247.1 ARMT1-like domain-containing protein [Desulfosporosinus sp. PR]
MRIHDKCLPCVVNQVIKVATITGIAKKEELLREVFTYLSKMDFEATTPEIIGEIFGMVKKHTNNPDPYQETRNYYNALFLKSLPEFEGRIEHAENSFQLAVRYAIVGNIIDFNPIHNTLLEDVFARFEKMEHLELAIDDSAALAEDISKAKMILYLGDNCGEICLDKILLKKIKELNPKLRLLFGVRGQPVVNDSIAEDAYAVGIDDYAEIIDNGDGSLGTVLKRTSPEFQEVYKQAEIVIAKGQANYECLNEENKNIYFLLMTKCRVIAEEIGVEEKKMICLKRP